MKGFVTWGCHLILSVLRWLNEFQVEVYTPYGAVSTRGTMIFLPGLLELYMYGRIYDPGSALYPSRVALAQRTRGWGCHTARGGAGPTDRRSRPRFVGFLDIWKGL